MTKKKKKHYIAVHQSLIVFIFGRLIWPDWGQWNQMYSASCCIIFSRMNILNISYNKMSLFSNGFCETWLNTVRHQYVLSLFHVSLIKCTKKLTEQTHTTVNSAEITGYIFTGTTITQCDVLEYCVIISTSKCCVHA